MHSIINDAAVAYRGVIPADCWHEPYMSEAALEEEIRSGVRFWGWDQDGVLIGVMGIQDVKDVTLIRHAYVRTIQRNRGIGALLLAHLRTLTQRPLLIGTWAAADWAIRFYVKNGFRVVADQEKATLLGSTGRLQIARSRPPWCSKRRLAGSDSPPPCTTLKRLHECHARSRCRPCRQALHMVKNPAGILCKSPFSRPISRQQTSSPRTPCMARLLR